MRIFSIHIRNLRRFEEFGCAFSPGFNVIIGENGAGKTTLLTFLRRVLSAVSPTPERLAAPADIRESIELVEGAPTRLEHHPWLLWVDGLDMLDVPFTTLDGDVGGVGPPVSERLVPEAKRLHREASGNPRVPLPLLAYFSPWREKPRLRKPAIAPSGAPRRLDGYDGAFDLSADFNAFARWFKGFEMQRVEDATSVAAVEAVRATVISCVPGCTDLRWVPVLNDIIVTIDGNTQPIWRLSDGFRTMLALVGELAWRAAVLNPAYGELVTKRVSGVVLIDELDLHLHPRWQRRVVDDLRRAFPNVQFIATTHSPFVVQSMRADEVVILGEGASLDYRRSSIEDIAEQSMSIPLPQRSARWQAMYRAASDFFARLDNLPTDRTERAEALADLDKLTEPFSDDPAFAAFLARKRALVDR